MHSLTTNHRFEDIFNAQRFGDRWLLVAALVDFVRRASGADLAAVASFVAKKPIPGNILGHALPCDCFAKALRAVTAVQDSGAIHSQMLSASTASMAAIEALTQLAYWATTLDEPSTEVSELLQELVRIAREMPRSSERETNEPLLQMVANAPTTYDQNGVRYGDYANCVEVRRHIMTGAVLLRNNPGVATPLYEGRSP